MMNELLPAIELETAPNPRFSVIWLHGLGADGNDFAPIVPELGLAPNLPIRFIFPHAPMIPVTCNNGYVMRAWYDIRFFDKIERHADESGVVASRTAIRALIQRENERGIDTKHIFLAGFSQGGAIAYAAGLTHPDQLAGIIALSTYIPSPELLQREFVTLRCDTPIFAAHGSMDPVVPIQLGELARKTVQSLGCEVQWQTYPMQHSVCMEEIAAIGAWLRARCKAIEA